MAIRTNDASALVISRFTSASPFPKRSASALASPGTQSSQTSPRNMSSRTRFSSERIRVGPVRGGMGCASAAEATARTRVSVRAAMKGARVTPTLWQALCRLSKSARGG
jgi:hypothetical protein